MPDGELAFREVALNFRDSREVAEEEAFDGREHETDVRPVGK